MHQPHKQRLCGAIVARAMHKLSSQEEENVARRWYEMTGTSETPSLVMKILGEIRNKVESAGPSLRIQADEDKRHRVMYRSIPDSEHKLQYFAARQIACRLLSAEGYLCDHCWLPLEEDCICDKLVKGSLWRGVKLWLYMHPKDFLRKNNTGKILWQSLESLAARLCIFGVPVHEDTMWRALQEAGRERVWCVYPERSACAYQVDEISIPENFVEQASCFSCSDDGCALHFILMDGTWTNSKAMLSRINARASKVWGLGEVPCVALSPTLHSTMHDLRPQPSVEKTCTAAAASQLLRELSLRRELGEVELEKSAQVIDKSIECLFDALANRRKRNGKSVCRDRFR